MALDTSDYYPYTPGSGCDPEGEKRDNAAQNESSQEETGKPEVVPVRGDSAASVHSSNSSAESSEPAKIEVRTEEDEKPPRGFMTFFSHAMSWVFSPVLVPTYAIILVFHLSMLSYAPTAAKLSIIGIVFALTAAVPALAVFVLTKFGDVSDMALSQRTDRLIPYIVEAGCMLACGYYLTTTGLPDWVGYFFIGGAIATAINFVVNFWWKISAHGAGMGGFIAMFLVMNRYGLPPYNLWVWCMGAVVAAGLLGMARVWLGRHTPLQTIAGEIVGFLGVMSIEFIFPVNL